MYKRLFLALFIAMLPISALAGDFTKQHYTSHLGYKIKAPNSWTRVDAATIEAMKNNLPQNIDSSSVQRFDVIFFPSAKDNTKSDFVPTISVLGLAEKPASMSQETIEAYADAITQSIPKKLSDIKDFKIVSSIMEPLSGGDAQIHQFTFTHKDRSLTVEQAIIINKEHTFVITCTQDSAKVDSQICHTVFNSIKFQ